jgi:hypothetical protein
MACFGRCLPNLLQSKGAVERKEERNDERIVNKSDWKEILEMGGKKYDVFYITIKDTFH